MNSYIETAPTLEQIYEIRKLFTQAYYISDFFLAFIDFMTKKCKSKFGQRMVHWNGFDIGSKNFTFVVDISMGASEIEEKVFQAFRDFLVICKTDEKLYNTLQIINPDAATLFQHLTGTNNSKLSLDYLSNNMLTVLHIGSGDGNVCRVNLI